MLLWLVACVPATVSLGAPVADDTAAPLDDHGCNELFDRRFIRELDLEMSPDDLAALQADFLAGQKVYHPCTLRYGDDEVAAQVRLKGNTYFWSGWTTKMQFVVSFTEDDPDARWHGLRKIGIDAPPYDTTVLRNRVALAYLRDRGVPTMCATSAALSINGEYQGVYALLEAVDHEFLERNWDDASGLRYKDGTILETDEDEGPDTSRDAALFAATDAATIESYLDVPEAMVEWSGEAMLPQTDGFWAASHNYYVYDHPTDGFQFIAYDLDFAFDGSEKLDPQPFDADPETYYRPGFPKPAMFTLVVADRHDDYLDAVAAARAAFHEDDIVAEIDEWDAQLAPFLEDDPNKPFTMDEHAAAVAKMRQFVLDRAAYVDGWLAERGR